MSTPLEKSKFRLMVGGDWEALYRDGKCVMQAHRLRVAELLAKLGLTVLPTLEATVADEAAGEFPDLLEEGGYPSP